MAGGLPAKQRSFLVTACTLLTATDSHFLLASILFLLLKHTQFSIEAIAQYQQHITCGLVISWLTGVSCIIDTGGASSRCSCGWDVVKDWKALPMYGWLSRSCEGPMPESWLAEGCTMPSIGLDIWPDAPDTFAAAAGAGAGTTPGTCPYRSTTQSKKPVLFASISLTSQCDEVLLGRTL